MRMKTFKIVVESKITERQYEMYVSARYWWFAKHFRINTRDYFIVTHQTV